MTAPDWVGVIRMLTPSTQVTLALVRAAARTGERHGLEILHNGGEMELVAGAGKTPEPQALEAMMRLQVGKAHRRPLPLIARSQKRRCLHSTASDVAGILRGCALKPMLVLFASRRGAGRLTMVGRLHGLTRVGRQFAAIVLTFALLLQGVALAAATGRLAANAATNTGLFVFELCQHSGSADDGSNASAPAGAPENSDAHCIFCLAGASYALQAALPSPAFYIIIIAIVPSTLTAWRLPALTVDASSRPRGPPPTTA